MSVMEYVSTPLPLGRPCMPLELFVEDRRAAIIEAALAPRPPVAFLDLGHDGIRPLATIPSRAWYEWYWHRGIDPETVRRRKVNRHTRKRIVERDGLWCRLCGGDVERNDVHIDHIIPWSIGGSDDDENLQVTHSKCNIFKGAKV